ncbi:MAG TPA: peptide ABC transporter substrate-binding protein, partial [Cyanothece sp. UBA12306]|nr:peptide ABC transporter substrate-binding protein [Cyanothece sp. UBA12306]
GNSLPYIQKIVVPIIESSDNQLLRFRSGELDTISVSPQSFSLLKREEKRGKFTIYNGGPLTGISFISFNLNQGRNKQKKQFVDPIKSRWFNNLAFRQAVAYSLNRERINNNIYRGLGAIQHSVLAVQSPYYLSPEQGLKIYDYDPNKGKQILLQEGFKYNNQNQLLDENGNQVQFNILVKSEDKSRIDIAVQIQEDLQTIGIKTNLETQSLPIILQRLLARRDWECYVGAFGVPGSEVEPNLLSLFWTSKGSFHQFNQGPQPRDTAIVDWVVSDWEKQIDRLFLEGLQTLDEAKRKEIYGEFQQVVAEQLPIFCLVNSLLLQAVRDRVQNVQFSAIGGAFWNIDELKIKD